MTAQSQLYTIEQLSINDLEKGSLTINQLLTNELQGFIINDFLNETEVASVLRGFRALENSELIHIEKDFDSYPMTFAQFDQMVRKNFITEETYFDISHKFIQSFSSRFGVDVVAKLQSAFKNIGGAPPVAIPENTSANGYYVPFTFRELFAGQGCLKAHCENLFLHEFPGFFDRISAFSKPENQLSFFIVVQAPGKGGELTLFDILWNKQQHRTSDHEITLEDDQHLAFDDKGSLRRDYLQPPVGSLIVFSGGHIWHRVETITQSPSRITLGGFLSFSHDGSNLYCWS